VSFTEAGNNSSGTPDVTNGTHTAKVTLLGLASQFTSASDGHGGTVIGDPSVAAANATATFVAPPTGRLVAEDHCGCLRTVPSFPGWLRNAGGEFWWPGRLSIAQLVRSIRWPLAGYLVADNPLVSEPRLRRFRRESAYSDESEQWPVAWSQRNPAVAKFVISDMADRPTCPSECIVLTREAAPEIDAFRAPHSCCPNHAHCKNDPVRYADYQ
jgi:hypothetical protein